MLQLIKTLHDELNLKLEKLSTQVLRETAFIEVNDKISVAIGMRRTGKTNLMLAKIQSFLDKGVPISCILYIDFEDDRLLPLDSTKLAGLIDDFYSLFPENHQRSCYLFFDEIQTIDDWAIVIRRFFNSANVKIYLSGSSAKMLSKEIATSLRGRSIASEVWPFSFKEFLSARHEAIPNGILSQAQQNFLSKQLLDYFEIGGFPGITHEDKIIRNKILQEYVDVVIYKDIIERNSLTNPALIKYMILYLLKNYATNFSINKFYHDLKSQGYIVGRSTLYDYLSYIEDAYLTFSVPLYSESIRKTQSNPKKIYAIDSGLTQAISVGINDNYGRILENLVFLDLRRRGDIIYYYLTKNRHEVDFFTKSLDGKLHLYQVALDISEEKTVAREQRALTEAEAELGITGEIITLKKYPSWILKNNAL